MGDTKCRNEESGHFQPSTDMNSTFHVVAMWLLFPRVCTCFLSIHTCGTYLTWITEYTRP